MKKVLFTALLALGMSVGAQAQLDYGTAIGLRAGETSGLTVKGSMGSNAFEGIIGIWNYGFTVTGLYEWITPTQAAGLNWYYGVGGHIAVNSGYHYWYDSRRDRYYRNGGMGLGIDGIVGIEYRIPRAPIAFSLDLKPYIEFNTAGPIFGSLDPGLGIKVVF